MTSVLSLVALAMFLYAVLAIVQLSLKNPTASSDVLDAVGDLFVNLLKELRKFLRIC